MDAPSTTSAVQPGRGRVFDSIVDAIGSTPIVRLRRLPQANGVNATILAKLEYFNPAASVKDRIGAAMIVAMEKAGIINADTVLIEPTSGNTGIALAMATAIKGYRMVLIMPEDLSIERAQTMKAFGAELILTPKSGGMESARDIAEKMQKDGKGRVLDQFANDDNWKAHYKTTGPEIWEDTEGTVTHFVSAMGTTGTIIGTSSYLKEKNPNVQIIGAQPSDGSQIPGIRKWPQEYLPKIFDASKVDTVVDVSEEEARAMTKRLALEEGVFAGMSSGGSVAVALKIAEQLESGVVVAVGLGVAPGVVAVGSGVGNGVAAGVVVGAGVGSKLTP